MMDEKYYEIAKQQAYTDARNDIKTDHPEGVHCLDSFFNYLTEDCKVELKKAIDRAYESASLAGGGISIEYNDTAKNRIKELYKEFGLI